jgi:NAD(P)-dependent dehydrogenase (short-subunit alcohol dehydrogenase family)
MAKLTGKIALVTGASRSIGRAIALRLAKDGAMVCITYVSNAEAAKETVAEIARGGGRAFALNGDIGAIDDVNRIALAFQEELRTRTGSDQFDILVNNAGIAVRATPDEFDEAQFDRQLNVNFKGPVFLTRALLHKINDGGRIINISSQTSQMALPMVFLYTASKAALDNYTRNLAKHLGKRGITVNTVAPGATDTDMNKPQMTPERLKALAESTPLGRVGQPEDIADAVAFVASDDARWVTGQYIAASGGAGL